jgi:hypothetical protein
MSIHSIIKIIITKIHKKNRKVKLYTKKILCLYYVRIETTKTIIIIIIVSNGRDKKTIINILHNV